ncbi:MAG: oligosaccharide flippase family protein [Candidatus Muiribacteriota bacterium]
MEGKIKIKDFLNHKVVKAGSWYTLSEFFLKGITFLTIPIFTRLLSTSDYGIVSLYHTWVAIFVIFFSISLRGSIGIAKTDFKNSYNQFVSSVTFLSIIIFAIFFIIFFSFSETFIKITGLTEFLFFFMLFQAYFMGIKNFLISKLRFEYKYKQVAFISIVTVITGIIFSVYLILNVYSNNPYFGAILGKGSLYIVSGAIFLFYIFFYGKTLINLKYWKYSLILGLPVVFHSLSQIINVQFDRILINKYIGESATGIYSFAYNVGMIVIVLISSFNAAWVPWFFEKINEKNLLLIKKRALSYRNIFTLIYSCILFVSPELIRLMADQSYWKGLHIIPWIFMAYYLQYMYTFEVNVEMAMKKNNMMAVGTVLSALINIGLNIIFIPKYGYEAAAITTVISYFFLFFFHFLITRFFLKKNIFGFFFHLKSLFYLVIITGIFMLFQNLLIIRLILIFLIFLLLYLKLFKEKELKLL